MRYGYGKIWWGVVCALSVYTYSIMGYYVLVVFKYSEKAICRCARLPAPLSFHLLAFIFSNRNFSMGTTDSNKKICRSALRLHSGCFYPLFPASRLLRLPALLV